ncbi:MAG: hypothetical protein CM1200mP7_1180 [Chloroflexota bacterium]|nr:MAG: hypothetical protein CM1200mP7_1180 [Chloroflexota bacterium]
MQKSLLWGKALNNINQIGFSQITSHVQSLSIFIVKSCIQNAKTRMITPINSSYPSGLISLKVEGRSAKDIQNELQKWKEKRFY